MHLIYVSWQQECIQNTRTIRSTWNYNDVNVYLIRYCNFILNSIDAIIVYLIFYCNSILISIDAMIIYLILYCISILILVDAITLCHVTKFEAVIFFFLHMRLHLLKLHTIFSLQVFIVNIFLDIFFTITLFSLFKSFSKTWSKCNCILFHAYFVRYFKFALRNIHWCSNSQFRDWRLWSNLSSIKCNDEY